MDLISIGLIILLLFGIIVLSFLFIIFVSVIFEISEWQRSRELFKLAKKYGLDFIRVKKEKRTWLNGWGSFSNDENNFILGTINNISVEFNDCLLVEGNLTYGFGYKTKPSIAEVSNKWNLSTSGGGLTRKLSKLNGVYYKRLSISDLDNLFEKISTSQINLPEDIHDTFKKEDFSEHIMRNRLAAGFVCSCLFVLIFWLAIVVYNNSTLLDWNNSLFWVILIDIIINIPIWIWVSKKYGKKFNPDDVNKPPYVNPRV